MRPADRIQETRGAHTHATCGKWPRRERGQDGRILQVQESALARWLPHFMRARAAFRTAFAPPPPPPPLLLQSVGGGGGERSVSEAEGPLLQLVGACTVVTVTEPHSNRLDSISHLTVIMVNNQQL